jgi:hypothetical protein
LFRFVAGGINQIMSLSGTIPIMYNGAQYNIPITVWIPEPYPYKPPVSLVTPVGNMIIKSKHQHVDSAGIVYLPYISAWNPRYLILFYYLFYFVFPFF